MSKKPFDHIEDRIRQAAENDLPSFNEAAWEKMSALLDNESSRKRPAFYWWLLPALILLLAGGGYLLFKNRPVTGNSVSSLQKEKISTLVGKIKNNESLGNLTGKKSSIEVVEEKKNSIGERNQSINDISDKQSGLKGNIKYLKINSGIATSNDSEKSGHKLNGLKYKGKVRAAISNAAVDDLTEKENKGIAGRSDEKEIKNNEQKSTGNEHDITTNLIKPDEKIISGSEIEKQQENNVRKDSLKEKSSVGSNNEIKKDVQKKNKSSRFYFVASAGADIASVKFLSFRNSKLVPSYGLGAGYQLTEKLSIQTGFYAGQKKYIAGPGDYKTKPGTYLGQVDIKRVDAVCMVYEIPITVRYTFLQKPTIGYFVTSGISSYIMKKEDYNYNYERYNIPYTGSYTYTGNKNLFSILSFSAGVDKKITNRLSVIVSPSVSIPLAGVGDGSVKLFSAGIQAGIKFKPSSKQ